MITLGLAGSSGIISLCNDQLTGSFNSPSQCNLIYSQVQGLGAGADSGGVWGGGAALVCLPHLLDPLQRALEETEP